MRLFAILTMFVAATFSGCATPPSADPSTVESGCAQQCAGNLTTCSSGFTLFPVIKQKQCNDLYDVCVKGCPARLSQQPGTQPASKTTIERLKQVDDLYTSGAISKTEHEAKRKQILESM